MISYLMMQETKLFQYFDQFRLILYVNIHQCGIYKPLRRRIYFESIFSDFFTLILIVKRFDINFNVSL